MAKQYQKNNPRVTLNGEAVWWRGLMLYTRRRRTVTRRRIGNTLYIITAECASDATETISEKLERLVLRRPLAKSYQVNIGVSLASRPNQSEYRVG